VGRYCGGGGTRGGKNYDPKPKANHQSPTNQGRGSVQEAKRAQKTSQLLQYSLHPVKAQILICKAGARPPSPAKATVVKKPMTDQKRSAPKIWSVGGAKQLRTRQSNPLPTKKKRQASDHVWGRRTKRTDTRTFPPSAKKVYESGVTRGARDGARRAQAIRNPQDPRENAEHGPHPSERQIKT